MEGHYQESQRKPLEWKNTFANHISDKYLICAIHKESLELQKEKTNYSIRK